MKLTFLDVRFMKGGVADFKKENIEYLFQIITVSTTLYLVALNIIS